MLASVLFRVTIVGLETILVWLSVLSALRTRLKSSALNTADARRFCAPVLASDTRLETASPMVGGETVVVVLLVLVGTT